MLCCSVLPATFSTPELIQGPCVLPNRGGEQVVKRDKKNSKNNGNVFIRVVTLRDSWARILKQNRN